MITLERTRCFGFCPDYVVTVCGNGTVLYKGRTLSGWRACRSTGYLRAR